MEVREACLDGNFGGYEKAMFSINLGPPWYITFITALAGVMVGGFITFIIAHAKTRSDMRWELKREAYNAILVELDQATAENPSSLNQTRRRKARHLMKLAYGQSEISTIADEILKTEFGSERQKKIDDQFMPMLEADLEKTIRDWWKIWQ